LTYLKEFKRKFFAEITSVPELLQSSYYRPIEGLRGLSVLLVVLYHFGINHFLKPLHFLINGRIGVDIFFVISGFLITTLLLKEKLKSGEISLKHFYIRRILRIVPVVYLFLTVLIVIYACYNLKISKLDFFIGFLFLKNLPVQSGIFTTHLWSLAVELQFYIIFPFLLAYNTNKYLIFALLIVIVVPLISVAGYYHLGILYSNPVIALITKITMYSFWNGPVIILIGSVFSILTFKGIIKTNPNSKNYFLAFILLLAAIFIHINTFILYSKYISEYLFAIIVAYIILLIISTPNFLSTILKSSVLVKIGVLSYSIYIWQQLFIGINNSQPWLQICRGYPVYIIFFIKLIVIFLISTLSYYFFERRFLIFKKKFK
jgi:peptidoglycan/LPS O-acetylase OafA/YrhL